MRSKKSWKPVASAAVMLAFVMGNGMSVAANAGDMQSWQKEVSLMIAKKQVYPRAALSREIEGTAKIKVTIDRQGNVTDYDVVQPTGHQELDSEIDRIVERISPLPSPPGNLSDSQLSFIIPLVWAIQ